MKNGASKFGLEAEQLSKAIKLKGIIHSFLKLEAFEDAVAACDRAISEFPHSLEFHWERARCLSAWGVLVNEEVDAWQSLISRFPEQEELEWFQKLGIALDKREKNRGAEMDLQRLRKQKDALHALALQRWPEASENKESRALAVRRWVFEDQAQFLVDQTDYEAAIALWYKQLELIKGTSDEISSLLTFYKMLKRKDKKASQARVDDLLEDFLVRWPPEAFRSLADKAENKSALQDLTTIYFFVGRRWFKQGREEQALEIWKHLPSDSHQAEFVRTNLPAFTQASSAIRSYSDRVDFDPKVKAAEPIVPWRCPTKSNKIVFVFSGIAGAMTMEVSIIHVILRELGCHLVYLSDLDHSFFLTGPTWQTPDHLCEQLAKIAQDFGASQVFTLGHSAGGYAALRYGAALNAESVLAFSPATAPMKLGSGKIKNKLRQMERKNPGLLVDLDAYFSQLSVRPKAKVAYGAECVRDRRAAELLSDFPEVVQEPVAGFSAHGVIRWYLANDAFESELKRLVDFETPE